MMSHLRLVMLFIACIVPKPLALRDVTPFRTFFTLNYYAVAAFKPSDNKREI
jgi:hypothetical protein